MLARFRRDEGGNFAIMTVFVMAPLLLAGMAAIDAANLVRTKTNVQHALDAAALAVGRRFGGGASEAVMQDYGQKFFAANLKVMNPDNVQFNIVLPSDGDTKKQISAVADLTYNSLFGTLANSLGGGDWNGFKYHMVSDVRVKNTVEVALVLDNSGSMSEKGTGSGEDRIDLLRTAATQLVDSMAGQAGLMTRIDKSVQFSVVPFAASVNVGPQYADDPSATWLDKEGRSSIHYENFDISQPITLGTNKQLAFLDGQYKRTGKGWPISERDRPYTRFDLFKELKIHTNWYGTQTAPFANWRGCVEARPGGYNLDDTRPSAATPDTLFVPMFAPDEYDTARARNDWWPDDWSNGDPGAVARQRGLIKYFATAPYNNRNLHPGEGPNYSCTTTPITPLTDVSTTAGLNTIRNAIDDMAPLGATNVPEGMAWGWRTISSGEPFTEGRAETERGNDKVVIVLTDGANTYYPRTYFRADDQAGSISDYSAFGYVGQKTSSRTRLFQNTSNANTGLHTIENYSAAMNEQFATLCDDVKRAKIIVMTVALDLDATKGNADERKRVRGQIDALTTCASDSRSRRDPGDASKPAKLFWNTTGGDLSETFRQIGDELSNLRIVG
ncbi:hypothetical protein C5748_19310 [Phyllobacterium phragmitis]|uniref:Putative Flp pilus-assembly TadG-like N-terminal domain-containing protein n=1 Tax=Phyllobacterium phragmitis TaxID=2670329 RepID=A0A2S9IMY8_9HYPH|nr:hypothetical protein C5748_19310 [Phyllobacterium phragmitis]